jgi:hypothetical protein
VAASDAQALRTTTLVRRTACLTLISHSRVSPYVITHEARQHTQHPWRICDIGRRTQPDDGWAPIQSGGNVPLCVGLREDFEHRLLRRRVENVARGEILRLRIRRRANSLSGPVEIVGRVAELDVRAE